MKDTFLIITTVPQSLNFFKGQVQVLKEKYNVEAVSSPGERLTKFAENEQVKVYAISMKREISIFSDVISLCKLYKLIKKIKPKVIHGNTPKGGFLSMLAAYMNNVQVRIYFLHGLRYEGTTGWKRKFLMKIERLACMLATHVFSVSYGVKETMMKDRITKKPVQIIWNGSINGIDTEAFDPKRVEKAMMDEKQIPKNSFVFGYVGRLVGDKGTNELITAFTQLHQTNPHIRLLLVGIFEDVQDPVSNKTRSLIKNHPGIVHVGYQADVKPYLKLMDVFVFPSYREGFGIVLMEAAAMQTPAISSDISGCNEIIQDGHNGLLIPPRSEKALQLAMGRLLKNPEEIKRMSLRAHEHVLKKYDQKKLWKKALETYTQLTS